MNISKFLFINTLLKCIESSNSEDKVILNISKNGFHSMEHVIVSTLIKITVLIEDLEKIVTDRSISEEEKKMVDTLLTDNMLVTFKGDFKEIIACINGDTGGCVIG
ncbi:hypothetical protein P3W45_001352 [Vairimorpha bombi]|jgi:hypothetical protein